MLKYLVILLNDNSVSYCHYNNNNESNMMPLDTLKKGILFAMKNDLKIQYVLPECDLPSDYINLIESMFHDNIGPLKQSKNSEIIVANSFDELMSNIDMLDSDKRYLVRTTIADFFNEYGLMKDLFKKDINANVVFTDVENFTDDKIYNYSAVLDDLKQSLIDSFQKGHNVNTNLITDRIALEEMNNCGAGETNITLAPNGYFYSCPAFYYSKEPYYELGNINDGLRILNKELYKLDHSPLCKRCDAYHCKRCVWLNKKLTCEINIPSRQQCLMAHIERNTSKIILDDFHKQNLLKEKNISKIDYLDPFEVYNNI